MAFTRTFVRSATAGGLAVAALLAVPSVGSAQPSGGYGPLLETTCSFEQVDKALHADAPQLAARLDQNPERKAKLQQLLSLPVEQRRQKVEEHRANLTPEQRQRIEQHRSDPRAEELKGKLAAVANSCRNY